MSRNFYPFTLLLIGLFVLLGTSDVQATHNRAGEITYRVIGDLSIEATVTTYTKASSVNADRDSVLVCWGDTNCEYVLRSNGNGNGELLPNDTKINKYIATHTYAGQAHYVISMTDPNRNGGVLNVNFPNADNVPFHLQTTVTFFNPLFQGVNNSPILEVPPIDIACLGQRFFHNPGAYDPDGDSLSYQMIIPLQDVNTPVPNYDFPREINPDPNQTNDHVLNSANGNFIWEFPRKTGEYNIAMYIIQHRNGVPIDTLIRDMQILVVDCDNMPPEIETEDEICVIAGETISFDVVATAPIEESGQRVDLRAFGAPLELDISPAEFDVASGYQPQPLTGTFTWQTTCEHIADQYYTVTFRAADDFPISDNSGGVVYLSTLKVVRIKVVGPPPEDLQAIPGNGQLELNWALPYDCEVVEDDYFRGFRIWRSESSNPFVIDTCDPGLEGRGYTLLTPSPVQDVVDGRYYYLDDEVERGRTYCYRIEARFARLSVGQQPFNWVSGLPSIELCLQLSRDIPLITNVSVERTDPVDGIIEVAWSTPNEADLDTMLHPGPYVYEVLRATGKVDDSDLSLFTLVPDGRFTSPTFAMAVDTIFQDSTGLNTLQNQYSYVIGFYGSDGDDTLGYTRAASSIFLNIASTDETNNLDWSNFDVPWDNSKYVVFRESAPDVWDTIGIVTEPIFSDTGLVNGQEYCYYVQSIGSYGIEAIIDPILNNSQEACGIPLDTIPPCPPELMVSNICDELSGGGGVNCQDVGELSNNLSWINPNDLCEDTDDVVSYNIYYTPIEGNDFELIETITNAQITEDIHYPDLGIAGCYAVTAVDSFFNESAFSNIVCKDNCPIYELPNTFTPNGDGANELFIPFPYCFVDRIEMQVFNRWGELVFETTNPDINWDGKNNGGTNLAEGVYFYTCRIFEQRVSGVVQNPDELSGYIHLIRGK